MLKLAIITILLINFTVIPLKAQQDYNYKDYNLVIIGFDALRAKNLGCFGYRRQTSPNIDNFAKESILFKNAISASSWTLPSFMSWFTSLYPSQHTLVNKYSKLTDTEQILAKLPENIYTLAQVLKENGYSTAAFTGDAGVTGHFGYNRGFDTYYDKVTFGGFDTTFPLSLEWLNKNKGKKFFLFIHGYDTHGKYNLASGFKSKFSPPRYTGRYKGTVEEQVNLRNLILDQKPLDFTTQDIEFWRAWYDGKIYEADKRFGNFLAEFSKLGLLDKTIIVVASDHGDEYCDHKGFDHGLTLYDELIHVPLIIRIPAQKTSSIKEQIRTIDIMPTVLELLQINLGKNIKEQIKGTSLVPLIQGKPIRLDAFSETDYLLQTFKRSLRKSNGWKFIYDLKNQERELYNLNTDPAENKNLTESEPKIAYELEQELFSKYLGY